MTGKHYEEVCRRFLADQLGIDINAVLSVEIPNAQRPGLKQYKHQIDLYWETTDSVANYVNIANGKWRASCRVEQGEILLLQKVKEELDAHKAVMLTNTQFTAGAIAVAKHHGIALHIVRPEFDIRMLSAKDGDAIRLEIQGLALEQGKPLYFHEVVHKAFDWAAVETAPPRPATSPVAGAGLGYGVGAPPGYSHKAITSLPNKAIGGGGGGHPGHGLGGGSSKGTGGPGFRTK
jgi:hypothetical protein